MVLTNQFIRPSIPFLRHFQPLNSVDQSWNETCSFNRKESFMKNKLHLFLLCLGMMVMQNTHAQYSLEKISNLRNDKELIIRSIKRNEQLRIAEKYNNEQEITQITKVFYLTIKKFLDLDNKQCELSLIDLLKKNFEIARIVHSEEGLHETFKMLRVTNAIDDLFYEVLVSVTNDYYKLAEFKNDNKV